MRAASVRALYLAPHRRLSIFFFQLLSQVLLTTYAHEKFENNSEKLSKASFIKNRSTPLE